MENMIFTNEALKDKNINFKEVKSFVNGLLKTLEMIGYLDNKENFIDKIALIKRITDEQITISSSDNSFDLDINYCPNMIKVKVFKRIKRLDYENKLTISDKYISKEFRVFLDKKIEFTGTCLSKIFYINKPLKELKYCFPNIKLNLIYGNNLTMFFKVIGDYCNNDPMFLIRMRDDLYKSDYRNL